MLPHTNCGGGEGRGEGGTFSAAALQRCACIMRYRGARAACAGILLADKLGARAEAETESESESGETESGGSGGRGGGLGPNGLLEPLLLGQPSDLHTHLQNRTSHLSVAMRKPTPRLRLRRLCFGLCLTRSLDAED